MGEFTRHGPKYISEILELQLSQLNDGLMYLRFYDTYLKQFCLSVLQTPSSKQVKRDIMLHFGYEMEAITVFAESCSYCLEDINI